MEGNREQLGPESDIYRVPMLGRVLAGGPASEKHVAARAREQESGRVLAARVVRPVQDSTLDSISSHALEPLESHCRQSQLSERLGIGRRQRMQAIRGNRRRRVRQGAAAAIIGRAIGGVGQGHGLGPG